MPLILGLLPAFAWLIFYLEEDPHPEPKKLVFETFLAGAIVTFVVLGIQLQINDWINNNDVTQSGFFAFLLLAMVEEFFKFAAAYLIINKHPLDFDEPVDAMIYLIVAALGFAAVENIAAVSRSGNIAFETTTLRFIGATLLHTLSSGLLGYYWMRSILFKKWNILIKGFGLAVLLHAVFNYLIIRFEPVVIPTIFLIIAALFVLADFEKLKHISNQQPLAND